ARLRQETWAFSHFQAKGHYKALSGNVKKSGPKPRCDDAYRAIGCLARPPSVCRGAPAALPGLADPFPVLAQEKLVGHPGDVIAYDAMARLKLRLLRVIVRHPFRVFEKERKKRIERRHRAVALLDHDRKLVEV